MLSILKGIIKSSAVTEEAMPEKEDGARGLPVIDFSGCSEGCQKCRDICPSQAISGDGVDAKGCIYCHLCLEVCPEGCISTVQVPVLAGSPDLDEVGKAMREKVKKVCGRSLHIRYVDAGACNGCDFEINSLTNPVYDIQQYGVDFVASPRHADMLLVTGSVTRNLEIALQKTYEAAPRPCLVVAVGSCACGGGIFKEAYAAGGGVDNHLPVDVFIPGCPPTPALIVKGILTAIDRI